MKKFIFPLFAAALLLTGCHDTAVPSQDTDTAAVPNLKIYAYKSDGEMPDAGMVVDAINDYIEPLIGVTIDITFVPYGSYLGKIHQILGSSEQLDLFITTSGEETHQLYREGSLAPLNTLLDQYAPDILPAVGKEYLQGGCDPKTGEYFGITTCRDYSLRTGIEYRKDLAQQYCLDMDAVHTLSDLTEIFAQIKELSPSVYPIGSASYYSNWDMLGDGLGVLMYSRMDTEVVNLYETPEYESFLCLIREWYQSGYLYDTVTDPGTNAYYLRSDRIFSSFANGKPGFVVQEERYLNCPIGFLPLEQDYISTDQLKAWMWAIPQNSKYQKEAMKFLNLLYSDETVVNLWTYGLEGRHYELIDAEKNIAGFPEGMDFTTSGYPLFMGFACGNQYLSHIWEGDSPQIWQELQSFNDDAVRSNAFGFQYDDTAVKSEVTACSVIVEKYKDGFLHGIYDVETVLPQWIQELKNAGIDRIIAEKQRQLDRWLSDSQSFSAPIPALRENTMPAHL